MAFDRNAEEDLAYGHKPVLLDGCLTGLNIRPDGIYVDGTLGRAGHSLEIARRLSGGGRLICLDRDETAHRGRARAARGLSGPRHAGTQQLQPSRRGAG